MKQLSNSDRALIRQIELSMLDLNFIADFYNEEFSLSVDTEGYYCMFRCKYSYGINSFPRIEMFERLCRGDDPLVKAIIPLEFALDRARQIFRK